jgi:hypothetical protein
MLSFDENAQHFVAARTGMVFATRFAYPDGLVPDTLGDCPPFFDETKMPRNADTPIAPVAFIIAASLVATWTCSAITHASGHTQGEASRPATTDIDSTWRHTKFGWQDSASWPVADSYVPVKTIEQVHPFVWAGTVLLGVIATMIWASSEWEIDRLFENDEEPTV